MRRTLTSAIFLIAFCLPQAAHAQKRSALSPDRRVQLPTAPLDLQRTKIDVETEIPTALPILVWVTIPNATDQPQEIRGGPGKYLRAEHFAIRVYRPRKAPLFMQPTNGQTTDGQLNRITIPPAGVVRVPLAIDALPAGDYQPELLYSADSSSPTRVTGFKLRTTAEAEARARWINRRIEEVRAGDPFSAAVCIKYRIDPVVKVLLDDLLSADDARAVASARVLAAHFPSAEAPKDWRDAISASLKKHANDAPQADPAKSVAMALATLVANQPQEQYLPEMIQLSASQENATRAAAVVALQGIDHPAAREQLAKLLDAEDANVRWLAANALLTSGDERALRAIAVAATASDAKPAPTRPELELLALFPDEHVATDAIDWARKSSDPYIHAALVHALNSGDWRVDPLGRRPPPSWMVSLTRQQAMKILLEATQFAVISEITAADPPKNVVAFRLIDTTSPGPVAANHLFSKATLAGKLYGLCNLQLRDSVMARRYAAKLIAQGELVTFLDGPKQLKLPVNEVIPKILSGEYPDRLSKIYMRPSATTSPK